MKTEKTINLTAYTVEYIDQREPKPRTVHAQTVVLDGGKISALNRLDMRPAGWITQQFEKDGYTVASIHKGETIAPALTLPSFGSIPPRRQSWPRQRNSLQE